MAEMAGNRSDRLVNTRSDNGSVSPAGGLRSGIAIVAGDVVVRRAGASADRYLAIWPARYGAGAFHHPGAFLPGLWNLRTAESVWRLYEPDSLAGAGSVAGSGGGLVRAATTRHADGTSG